MDNQLSPNQLKKRLFKEMLTGKEVHAILEYTSNKEFVCPTLDKMPDRLPYRNLEKNKSYIVSRHHDGQRKLNLAEVGYLTEHGHLSNTVVYAGAAPGTHIMHLMELFPKHKFILWDPAKYDDRLMKIKSPNLELHNLPFLDESAMLYSGQNVLFISDIRSDVKGFEAFEAGVHQNNTDQRRWVKIMKPVMSSLKFRIPFTFKGDYEYLDGIVYLQPWAPEHSAETRLVTTGETVRTYNSSVFENKLFWYNFIVREFSWYQHNIDTKLVEGLCHCSDCCYEIYIWRKFLQLKNISDDEQVVALMNKISTITQRSLLTTTHGVMPDVPPVQKRHQFRNKTSARSFKKSSK